MCDFVGFSSPRETNIATVESWRKFDRSWAQWVHFVPCPLEGGGYQNAKSIKLLIGIQLHPCGKWFFSYVQVWQYGHPDVRKVLCLIRGDIKVVWMPDIKDMNERFFLYELRTVSLHIRGEHHPHHSISTNQPLRRRNLALVPAAARKRHRNVA